MGSFHQLKYFGWEFTKCYFCWQKLRRDLAQLQRAIADLSALSVAAVSKKALDYAMRPTSEFNKYEALDILETLQNSARGTKHKRAEYYRLAFQMARSKIEFPHQNFQSLVLHLLGDKDQQRVFDALAKVEKSMKTTSTSRAYQYRFDSAPYSVQRPDRVSRRIRCFHCNRFGHVWSKCMIRKSETAQSNANRNMSDKQYK